MLYFRSNILLLGAFLFLFLISCERKPFRKVEVKGRILNYYTGQPISTGVALRSDNKFSGSSDGISIGGATSDKEGYFVIKGRASKASTYYLSFDGGYGKTSVDVKENQVTDVGNFYSGSYTLNVKVTLIPDSGKCFRSLYPSFSFPAGTNTVFVFQTEKKLPDSSFYYAFGYSSYPCISKPGNYSWLTSPILGIDTARFTIRY